MALPWWTLCGLAFKIVGDLFQAGFEFLFGREVELVFRSEDVGVLRQCELDEGVVFPVAEDDADGGKFAG